MIDLPTLLRNRCLRRFVGVALLAVIAVIAWAQRGDESWRLVTTKEGDLGNGVRYVERQLQSHDKCIVRLVVFEETKAHIEVVANTTKADAKWLREIAPAHGAIAGCNGGYFDPPKMLPACLEIAGGVSTGTYGSTGPKYGALFGVRNGKLFIESEAEFRSANDVSELVQCSPILMQEAKAHRFGGDIDTARTFVVTDGLGRWAIGTATHAKLDDLAEFMDHAEALLGIKVTRAMNLDGGPSTALWCKELSGKVNDIHEGWKVRNVLLVVPGSSTQSIKSK